MEEAVKAIEVEAVEQNGGVSFFLSFKALSLSL